MTEIDADERHAISIWWRGLGRCAVALSIALLVSPATAQEDVILSGDLEAILPQEADLPGPMTALVGDWTLSVEDEKPVFELTLEWSGNVDEATEATLNMVAVVQTPTMYVAFLDISSVENLAANTRRTFSSSYEWYQLLSTDFSGRSVTYLDAESARQALQGDIRISQMIITSVEFKEP